jgi:hypothetical protein
MNDEKKNASNEEKMNTDQSMNLDESAEGYEVGYGKPPKHTRFRKGTSGNPSGRPKKTVGFDDELIREFNSPITVSENGKRRRIPKVRGIFKQMTNKALAGDVRAARVVLPLYQEAQDRATIAALEEAHERDRLNKPDELTMEELEFLVLGGDPKELLRRRKVEKEFKKKKPN